MLLLDEPLNGVDAQTRTVVRDVLRSLSAAGKTIVAATHDPHDIEVEFEKIIHMTAGQCDAVYSESPTPRKSAHEMEGALTETL